MSIKKTAAGSWQVDVTVGERLDGKRDRKRRTFPTKREAEAFERKCLVERDMRHGRSYGGIAFRDFVEDYFWPQKTRLRETTKLGYRRDLKLRLLPFFGNMPIEEIDRYSIQKMISACASRKVATNARETLSSILSLAVEMKLIDSNPAGYRYEYPEANRKDPDYYGVWLSNFDEIREVVEYMAAHHAGTAEERMVVLGLCFGLRKGEVLGLDWDDVDFGSACINIRRSYTVKEGGAVLHDPKTPKATRPIPMIRLARERMESWEREAQSVVSYKGKRLNPFSARDRLNKIFCGGTFDDGRPLPRITLFSMRHSFGTACIDANIEVSKLSAWMGHVDVSTTYNRYVKPKLEALKNNASEIDKAMGF